MVFDSRNNKPWLGVVIAITRLPRVLQNLAMTNLCILSLQAKSNLQTIKVHNLPFLIIT